MSERKAAPTAEQVAAALANVLEPIGPRKKCDLCAGDCRGYKTKLKDHAATCPWRLAQEWRAALRRETEPRHTKSPALPIVRCAASRDGDCYHPQCPQEPDGEPAKSGRHCPIDTREDDE